MSDINTAESGREAMDKAKASVPDVVLMDTQMKSLSGYDAARLIKAKYPNVNIIMLGVWNKSTDVGALLQMLAQADCGE